MADQSDQIGKDERDRLFDLVKENLLPFDKTTELLPVVARATCLRAVDVNIEMFNFRRLLVPEAKSVLSPAIEPSVKEFIPDSLSPAEAVRNAQVVFEAAVKWSVRFIYEWRFDRWPTRILNAFDRGSIPALLRTGIEDRLPYDHWMTSLMPKFEELVSIEKSRKVLRIPASPLLDLIAHAIQSDEPRKAYSEADQKQDANDFSVALRNYLLPIIAAIPPMIPLAPKPIEIKPDVDNIQRLHDWEHRLRLLTLEENQVRSDSVRPAHERIALLEMMADDRRAIEGQIKRFKEELNIVEKLDSRMQTVQYSPTTSAPLDAR